MDDKKRLDFRALSVSRDLMWHDVSEIPWDHVPVQGTDEYVYSARDVAGKVRNFTEFYTREQRTYAMSLENWLIRYSLAHTHPSLRS
ncbi:hypothetical protein ACIOHC_36225 [Streptomyces sp. NPDC088252]|uniref:hypothetical protein n=1 Tax=Streptomyces sp. NPDC088252 TaxID=3365845 RepID=UPI00381DF01D